jgi:hypothetical protein
VAGGTQSQGDSEAEHRLCKTVVWLEEGLIGCRGSGRHNLRGGDFENGPLNVRGEGKQMDHLSLRNLTGGSRRCLRV